MDLSPNSCSHSLCSSSWEEIQDQFPGFGPMISAVPHSLWRSGQGLSSWQSWDQKGINPEGGEAQGEFEGAFGVRGRRSIPHTRNQRSGACLGSRSSPGGSQDRRAALGCVGMCLCWDCTAPAQGCVTAPGRVQPTPIQPEGRREKLGITGKYLSSNPNFQQGQGWFFFTGNNPQVV